MEKLDCQRCGRKFLFDEDDEEAQRKLCYDCFETSLEEFEEKRRERIARENEY